MTFTAGGQGHGEFVQLLWDAFSVGRLDTEAEDITTSCPEGETLLSPSLSFSTYTASKHNLETLYKYKTT